MTTQSFRYAFHQDLAAPVDRAFAWCTDYRASDAEIIGDGRTRSVRWLSEDAVVLLDKERLPGGRRDIHRLVRLDPEHASWTSTHLDGPFRHSQFWYRIVPAGAGRSRLEFRGLALGAGRSKLPPSQRRRIEARMAREDAAEWRECFAPALARDLRGR